MESKRSGVLGSCVQMSDIVRSISTLQSPLRWMRVLPTHRDAMDEHAVAPASGGKDSIGRVAQRPSGSVSILVDSSFLHLLSL